MSPPGNGLSQVWASLLMTVTVLWSCHRCFGGPCSRLLQEETSRPLQVVAGVYGHYGRSSSGDTVATSTPLHLPRGIAVDDGGRRLFLADSANHVVRLLDLATGNIPVIVGTVGQCGSGGDLGLAAAAQLCRPHGVAWDAASRHLYVADSQNHAVRRLELPPGEIGVERMYAGDNGNYVHSGSIMTVVGMPGSSGRSGDGGPPNRAKLNFPVSVTIDIVARRLYVADHENHAVRLVDLAQGIISTLAGVPGMPGIAGDAGVATAALLRFPMGMAVNPAQGLYIADYGNHAVRHVDLVSGHISTVAGVKGLPGSPGDGAKDGEPATIARLRYPSDVELDLGSKHLYIAGSSNPAVRRVNLSTQIMHTVVARPGRYSGPDEGGPVGLGLDTSLQRLFLSETYNHIVRYINLSLSHDSYAWTACQ